jgi:hypothetical protein
MGNDDDDDDDAAGDGGPLTSNQYAAEATVRVAQLYDEQKHFFDAVIASLLLLRAGKLDYKRQLFFLTGDGGTGKTFAYNVRFFCYI